MLTNAKIYKLVCGDQYYIGCTTDTPYDCMFGHKYEAQIAPHRRHYKLFLEMGWESVEMEILERFPCETREQLNERKKEYLRAAQEDAKCLNNRPRRPMVPKPPRKQRPRKEKCKAPKVTVQTGSFVVAF